MGRHPTFASLSRQRRRAPPAALDLTRSTFCPAIVSQEKPNSAQIIDLPAPKVLDCLNRFEEEQARASAELEHTQAEFTAALESEPLPGVRARSPTAYRSAGRAIPMDVEHSTQPLTPPEPPIFGFEKTGNLLPEGGYRFPLLDGAYQFPEYCAPSPRPSTVTIELRKKKSTCISIPWSTMMQILKLKGKRRKGHGHILPEPLGFQDRIKNSGHEWRPAYSQFLHDNKGELTALNSLSSRYAL